MISAPKEDSQLATLYKSNILDPLDKLVISPNRLVTLRTGVSITVAACLAFSENLGVPIEAGLIALGTAALVADKTDGDLARHTDQCSDEGEVLDAGADKVIVYTSLLFVLLNLPENVSTNTQNWLMTGVGISFVLDVISQGIRGTQENINAAKAYWKKPLTTEERKENATREKTKNASNMFGKLKTGAIMTSLGVGLEGVIPLDEETRAIIVTSLVLVSVTLGSTSLAKKLIKKDK